MDSNWNYDKLLRSMVLLDGNINYTIENQTFSIPDLPVSDLNFSENIEAILSCNQIVLLSQLLKW